MPVLPAWGQYHRCISIHEPKWTLTQGAKALIHWPLRVIAVHGLALFLAQVQLQREGRSMYQCSSVLESVLGWREHGACRWHRMTLPPG